MSLNKNIENLQNALSSLERKVGDIYEAGKQSMVDPTKIIEKTVSGSFITVNDVSEIPHKCTLSVNNDSTITVCGKNLLAITEKQTHNGITATMDSDGTIHLNGTATGSAWLYFSPIYTLPIAHYHLSIHNATTDAIKNIGYRYKDGSHNIDSLSVLTTIGKKSYNIKQIDVIEFNVLEGTVLNDATLCFLLEEGSEKTEYEPCKGKTYKLTTGQTIETDSICPFMLIRSNNGADVSFTYNRSWGREAEWGDFWDVYQDYGNRTLYQEAFAYLGWKDANYKPKYPLKPVNASGMFFNTTITVVKNVDFSNCSNMDKVFQNAITKEIGVVDVRNAGFYFAFNNAKQLHTIEKLILKEDGSQTFPSTFVACNALENLTIEGTIGNNLDIHWSTKLTHDSLMSIIKALMYVKHTYTKTSTVFEPAYFEDSQNFAPDWPVYTTTGEKVLCARDAGWNFSYCCLVDGVYYAVTEATNATTYTLTLGATNLAKLDDFEKGIATEKGWTLA